MNILIYGAGAIGSFVGYLLSSSVGTGNRPAENVALLGRSGHIKRIRSDGLRVSLPEGKMLIRFKYCFFSLEELDRSGFNPDIVIVSVKTHSLARVFDEISSFSLLRGSLKEADFILLMNGMGNREVFDLPSGRIYEGVTSIGVVHAADGEVVLKGTGKTLFQEGISEDRKRFIETSFLEKGFEAEFTKDFKRHQWSKLIVNAAINPITAITGRKNGVLLGDNLKRTVRGIVLEAVHLANLERIEIDDEAAINLVYSVAEKTEMNTSSMLQDVLKGRNTEIEAINGYLVRLAEEHGLDVPVNTAMYEIVKLIGVDEDQRVS